MTIATVILAAGQSNRMRSATHKVLHKLACKPLIAYVIDTAEQLDTQQIITVINPQNDTVKSFISDYYPKMIFCEQTEPLGTGHAVLCALPAIDTNVEFVVVLLGDTPLISRDTLNNLLITLKDNPQSVLGVVGFATNNPEEYGRLMIKSNQLVAIIEAKEITSSHQLSSLCNSGIMILRRNKLAELIPQLTTNNNQNELYLTDLVKLATTKNYHCSYLEAPKEEVIGINNKIQLAEAEKIVQNQLRTNFLKKGVTIINPDTVTFSYDIAIGNDVTIHPYVVFGTKVIVEDYVEIKSFCHLEGTLLKSHATIGPFARTRPNTIIDANAHVGNFVEIKNSYISHHTKINHLSYIGDTQIGYHTNIGAGTITCNYDGINKYKTIIGNNVFIGSNSCLVAPLTIEEGVLIGAGSTITQNVPADALALTRAPVRIIQNGAIKFKQKKTHV